METLGPAMGPEVAREPALVLHGYSLKVPGGTLAKFSQTVGSIRVLKLGSSPSLPQSPKSPTGTGTQQ